MNPEYKKQEYLFPWMRLKRIERELDAEERVGSARLYTDFWTKTWPKQQMEIFNREPMYLKLFNFE